MAGSDFNIAGGNYGYTQQGLLDPDQSLTTTLGPINNDRLSSERPLVDLASLRPASSRSTSLICQTRARVGVIDHTWSEASTSTAATLRRCPAHAHAARKSPLVDTEFARVTFECVSAVLRSWSCRWILLDVGGRARGAKLDGTSWPADHRRACQLYTESSAGLSGRTCATGSWRNTSNSRWLREDAGCNTVVHPNKQGHALRR